MGEVGGDDPDVLIGLRHDGAGGIGVLKRRPLGLRNTFSLLIVYLGCRAASRAWSALPRPPRYRSRWSATWSGAWPARRGGPWQTALPSGSWQTLHDVALGSPKSRAGAYFSGSLAISFGRCQSCARTARPAGFMPPSSSLVSAVSGAAQDSGPDDTMDVCSRTTPVSTATLG